MLENEIFLREYADLQVSSVGTLKQKVQFHAILVPVHHVVCFSITLTWTHLVVLCSRIALWDAHPWLRFYALTRVPKNEHSKYNLFILKIMLTSFPNWSIISGQKNCQIIQIF